MHSKCSCPFQSAHSNICNAWSWHSCCRQVHGRGVNKFKFLWWRHFQLLLSWFHYRIWRYGRGKPENCKEDIATGLELKPEKELYRFKLSWSILCYPTTSWTSCMAQEDWHHPQSEIEPESAPILDWMGLWDGPASRTVLQVCIWLFDTSNSSLDRRTSSISWPDQSTSSIGIDEWLHRPYVFSRLVPGATLDSTSQGSGAEGSLWSLKEVMGEGVNLISACDRGLAPLKFILRNTNPGKRLCLMLCSVFGCQFTCSFLPDSSFVQAIYRHGPQ